MKSKQNHSSIKYNPQPRVCSAPGKLILMGEHAVLHGYPCIVAAVDQRLRVSLIPRDDDKIFLHSAEMGNFETTVSEVEDLNPPQEFLFVLKTVQSVKPQTGFEMTIDSDFSSTIGFGSSAAVTVATLGALLGESLSKDELFERAYAIIYTAQGKKGSGADIAASVYGGISFYKMGQRIETVHDFLYPLTAVYAGYKTPTPQVIKMVAEKENQNPDYYKKLYAAMGAICESGWNAIKDKNKHSLGKLMNDNQALLKDLGVSDETLDDIFLQLNDCNDILGAKISGSGLGDCVIGLGESSSVGDYETRVVSVANEGVRFEYR